MEGNIKMKDNVQLVLHRVKLESSKENINGGNGNKLVVEDCEFNGEVSVGYSNGILHASSTIFKGGVRMGVCFSLKLK
jgi:hypothetical protein